MMGARSYRPAIVPALHVLSAGFCYWPQCPVQSVIFVDGDPEIAVDVAHIRGLNPGSARHDDAMSDGDRNSFANLLLLCRPHHKRVDNRENEFPPDVLADWKMRAEGRHRGAFDALARESWTAEGLEQAITDVVTDVLTERIERLDDAITRLEEVDLEAATLLRSIIDKLEDAQLIRPLVSSDDAEILNQAAGRLNGLDDSAAMLAGATRRLTGLADTAGMLADAANNLSGLEDTAILLSNAARQLDSAVSRAQDTPNWH